MKRQKTFAKRIGIKSTVAYGEGMYAITTFGRGAKAEIAVKSAVPIENTLPASSPEGAAIRAKFDNARGQCEQIDPTRIRASRAAFETLIANPVASPRADYLELKDALEELFFGRKFPNDTVRVQIIYSILDIQKILGLYVADIMHFVDSLQDEPEDLVALGLGDDKMKRLLAASRPYFGFFGGSEVFINSNSKKKDEAAAANKHNAKVFRALGAIRQKLANFNWQDSLAVFADNDAMPDRFFQGVKDGRKLWNDVVAPLWGKRLLRVRKSFVSNAARNLWLLYEIFGDDTDDKKRARARQYYHFSVLKEGKNLGFNITKTREYFLDRFYPVFHEPAPNVKRIVDTFRSKLYAILDFVIYEATVRKEESGGNRRISFWQAAIDAALTKLREAPDGDAKERVYKELVDSIERDSLSLRLKKVCESFLKTPDANKTSEKQKTPDRPTFPEKLRNNKEIAPVNPVWLEATNEENATAFVQLMAFLCNFLEGKEINELIAALVRKFDGVQSALELLRELEGDDAVRFTPTFDLFNDRDGTIASRIAQELRLLASVGKMKPDMTAAKRALYKNALAILGAKDEEVSDEWLSEHILLDKTSANYATAKKDVNPFRNYVAKNVITSRAFYYLVRYAKPTAVRKLMSNPKIVRYVLKRMPDAQVDSYYLAIRAAQENDDNTAPSIIKKIDRLVAELAEFSFDALFKDENKEQIVAASRNPELNLKVERLRKLTALYMSVAYIAVKNVVKVNARYFIAYSALERDLWLFKEKYGEALTSKFIDFELNGAQRQFKYLAILDYYLARDEQNLMRKCEICAEISDACKRFYSKKTHTPEEEANKRAEMKRLNSERKRLEKELHFSTKWAMRAKNRDANKEKHPQKWYDILKSHRAELVRIHATGWLATQARNDALRLNTVNQFADYIEDVRRFPEGTDKSKDYQIGSYFEIFHYIRQRSYLEKALADKDGYRALFTEEQLEILQKKLETIRARASYDKDLLKLEFLPFAYNLPRFKNLTTEALFDDDSESGKKRAKEWEARLKEKAAKK